MSLPLEVLESLIRLLSHHLNLKYLDAVKPKTSSIINALLNRSRLSTKLPERVGRDTKPDWAKDCSSCVGGLSNHRHNGSRCSKTRKK